MTSGRNSSSGHISTLDRRVLMAPGYAARNTPFLRRLPIHIDVGSGRVSKSSRPVLNCRRRRNINQISHLRPCSGLPLVKPGGLPSSVRPPFWALVVFGASRSGIECSFRLGQTAPPAYAQRVPRRCVCPQTFLEKQALGVAELYPGPCSVSRPPTCLALTGHGSRSSRSLDADHDRQRCDGQPTLMRLLAGRGSLNGRSFPARQTRVDPQPPVDALRSCLSTKVRLKKIRVHEAAVRALLDPAASRRSPRAAARLRGA